MATRSVDKLNAGKEIMRYSGNVFANLANAEEGQMKLRPANAIDDVIVQHPLDQVAASERRSIGQPTQSALANCKHPAFSIVRPMTLLTELDQDVEIVIQSLRKSRPNGELTVAPEQLFLSARSH
jgi:predicted XRE-type DNA-binding protein